jgi:hypothetical protein
MCPELHSNRTTVHGKISACEIFHLRIKASIPKKCFLNKGRTAGGKNVKVESANTQCDPRVPRTSSHSILHHRREEEKG